MDRESEHIRDEFSPLLDGELSPEERAAIEAKLAGDAELLRELDALKRVDRLYRDLPAEKAPADFEERVRHALREPAAPRIRKFRPRFVLWTAVAAAAGLLVVVGTVLLSGGSGGSLRHMAKSEPEAASEMEGRSRVAPSLATGAREKRRELPAAPPEAQADVAVAEVGQEQRVRDAADAMPADGMFSEEAAEADEAALDFTEEEPARPSQEPGLPEALLRDEAKGAPLGRGTRALAARPLKDRDAEGVRDDGLQVYGGGATGSSGAAVPKTVAPSTPAMKAPEEKDEAESSARGARGGARVEGKMAEAKPMAQAAPLTAIAPEASETREDGDVAEKRVAGRTFLRKDGVWRQKEYRKQTTVSLVHGGKALRDLVAKYKELAAITRLKGRVVFRVDDTWYELVPPPSEKKPASAPPAASESDDR